MALQYRIKILPNLLSHLVGSSNRLSCRYLLQNHNSGSGCQGRRIERAEMNHSLEAVVQRLIVVVKELHDGGSPHNRAAGQSACQHLGKAGEIRSDSVQSLRSSGAESKSGYNLVEDQDNIVARRDLPEPRQELRDPDGTLPQDAPEGSRMTPAISLSVESSVSTRSKSSAGSDTVFVRTLGGDTQRAIRIKRRLKAVNHLIVPAMKMPFKTKDLVPACVGASQP